MNVARRAASTLFLSTDIAPLCGAVLFENASAISIALLRSARSMSFADLIGESAFNNYFAHFRLMDEASKIDKKQLSHCNSMLVATMSYHIRRAAPARPERSVGGERHNVYRKMKTESGAAPRKGKFKIVKRDLARKAGVSIGLMTLVHARFRIHLLIMLRADVQKKDNADSPIKSANDVCWRSSRRMTRSSANELTPG